MLCSKCNKEVNEVAAFCPWCGAEMEAQESRPVQAQENESPQEEDIYIPRPRKAKEKRTGPLKGKKKWTGSIIRASITLGLALILVIMAFLPVVSYELIPVPDAQAAGRLRPIDTMTLFVASMRSLDQEELEEKREYLYEKHEDLIDEYLDLYRSDVDYEDLTHSEKKVIDRYLVLYLRLSMMDENALTNPMLVCMAVLSLLYVLLCVALFVVGTLHLLSLFGILGVHPDRAWRWVVSLFSFVPVCLIALFFSCYAYFSNVAHLSGASITVLSLVAAFFVGAMIVSPMFGDRKKRPHPVPKILVAVFALAVILSVFTPVLHSDLRMVFAEKEDSSTVSIPVRYTYFNGLILGEDDVEEMDDLNAREDFLNEEDLRAQLESFSMFTVKQVKNGYANGYNALVLRSLAIDNALYKVYPLFALLPVFVLAGVIFAALIFRQALVCCVIAPKKRAKSPLVFKILLSVFLAVALCLVIVFLSNLSQQLNRYDIVHYRVNICGGIIVALSVSALLFFVPVNERLANKRKAPRDRNFYTVFEEEAVTEEAVN